MAEPRECIECRKIKPIRAKGKCNACYERKRRKLYPEMYARSEQKRAKTQKRKEWQHKHNREYYARNAEDLREYQRNWRRNNPEQRDEYKRRRRARVANLPSTLTQGEWHQILKEFCHLCAYCGSDGNLVKEHWTPAYLGGGYTKENIVPSCQRCNSRKGTMTGEKFMEQLDLEEWQLILEMVEKCAS